MVNVLVQAHAYVTGDGDHMTAVSPSAWVVVRRTSIALVPMSVGVRMATMVAPVSFARHALSLVSSAFLCRHELHVLCRYKMLNFPGHTYLYSWVF